MAAKLHSVGKLYSNYTFSCKELFYKHDRKKIITKGRAYKKYKARSKERLIGKIFLDFLFLVIEDCINGNVYQFPSQNGFFMLVEQVPDKDLKIALSKGYYKNLDLIQSGFKAYRLVVKNNYKTYYIHLSEDLNNKIIELTNKGKVYAAGY